jgi:predicted enzyme related to lactoylglutathione lyase
MLSDFTPYATLPASDIERAKKFYEKLGFVEAGSQPDGSVYYESGDSRILVYPSTFAGTNQATAVSFAVDDIDAAMDDLKGRGVTFEDYDFGDFKTVDGVMTMPDGSKGGWFKDTEGNILAVFQEA